MTRLAVDFLAHEAQALLTRLDRVPPFALSEVMVPAANVSAAAQSAIERYLATGRQELRHRIARYLRWLGSTPSEPINPVEAQRRFTVLRLRFNAVLTQFDLFADALSQRSERNTGVWLSGLDAVASDALRLPGYYESPPVVCYLDRGVGAAIRRARTRLPGGGQNPVAVIRVPRERMVGSGIASSLVHEVGHQAAALLGLVDSLRRTLKQRVAQAANQRDREAWQCYERWISEIVADFWSVARVGITSTMGLMGVVSLPRAFVFRINLDDPHPVPWFRVKLSCAMGQGMYPHSQWDRLASLWESFYPKSALSPRSAMLLDDLEARLPAFTTLLINHRPEALSGLSLIDVLDIESRSPARLRAYYEHWAKQPEAIYQAQPTVVFAAMGQQRADGRISPATESRTLARMLVHWALHGTFATTQRLGGTQQLLPTKRLSNT